MEHIFIENKDDFAEALAHHLLDLSRLVRETAAEIEAVPVEGCPDRAFLLFLQTVLVDSAVNLAKVTAAMMPTNIEASKQALTDTMDVAREAGIEALLSSTDFHTESVDAGLEAAALLDEMVRQHKDM